jgi:hypothetical protein
LPSCPPLRTTLLHILDDPGLLSSLRFRKRPGGFILH